MDNIDTLVADSWENLNQYQNDRIQAIHSIKVPSLSLFEVTKLSETNKSAKINESIEIEEDIKDIDQ